MRSAILVQSCGRRRGQAPVAQRIEHLTTDQKVGGSNPSGRAPQFGRLSIAWQPPDANMEHVPHGGARRLRLVGRDQELSALGEQLDVAVATGRRIVLLAGEAGLGKTALVEAFASSLAGRRTRVDVVRGLCVPMGEAGLPFTPVLGLLRAIEELHGTDRLVEWAGGGRRALGSLLPDLLQPAEPAEDLQLQLFEAVTRVVQGAAGVAPLVVLVEDVHWADESSRALLQFLARRLGEAPVLLVCTVRPDEVSGPLLLRPFLADLVRLPWTVRIDLSRLGRAEVASMLSAPGGPRPTAELVDSIHRRSEGVPFYVEELACWTGGSRRTGVPARRPGGSHQPAGRTGCASSSGLMAVGGIRVHHELLIEASGADSAQVDGLLREAVDVGVVRVDGDELTFRHALFGEALYADCCRASASDTTPRSPRPSSGVRVWPRDRPTTSSRCTGRARVSTSAPSRRRPVRCEAGRPPTPRRWRCTSGCSSSGTWSPTLRRWPARAPSC